MVHELEDLVTLGNTLPPVGFSHTKPLSFERISPIMNVNWIKPKGGLWLSPLRGEGTVWTEWLATDGEGLYEGETLYTTPVALAADSRFLTINTWEDFQRALSCYMIMPWLDSPIEYMQTQVYLDFEVMARDWDGFYLTEAGQWATRFTKDANGANLGIMGPNLYGWDLETVLVFHKNIAS